MKSTLNFTLTLGLTAFMAARSINTLKAIKSPTTGKFFFITDTGDSGKISEALSAAGTYDDCSVSLCNDPTAGVNDKPFFMMHLSNEDNVVFVKRA